MNELDFNKIGQKIRKRRQELGLKQEEVAEFLEVNPSHISNIECGRANPSLTALVNLANILCCNVDFFLEEEYHYPRQDAGIDEEITRNIQGLSENTKEKLLKIIHILKE